MPWKMGQPFKNVSIKKWIKEIKQKSKDDKRLQRAEVHAAVSVAGLAAALAAIAAENSSKHDDESSSATKDTAVASAAALVAAQCAKVAEAMGARKEQLRSVIGSAMTGTSASDVLTLTAAATTCNLLFSILYPLFSIPLLIVAFENFLFLLQPKIIRLIYTHFPEINCNYKASDLVFDIALT